MSPRHSLGHALWINQEIAIRGVIAPVKPRPSGKCESLRRILDCLVMGCDREKIIDFWADKCGHCVRVGISCGDKPHKTAGKD